MRCAVRSEGKYIDDLFFTKKHYDGSHRRTYVHNTRRIKAHRCACCLICSYCIILYTTENTCTVVRTTPNQVYLVRYFNRTIIIIHHNTVAVGVRYITTYVCIKFHNDKWTIFFSREKLSSVTPSTGTDGRISIVRNRPRGTAFDSARKLKRL